MAVTRCHTWGFVVCGWYDGERKTAPITSRGLTAKTIEES